MEIVEYYKTARHFKRIIRGHWRWSNRVAKFVPFRCHVVSGGGVGTTMLIQHLNSLIPTNDAGDRDVCKHLPKPIFRYASQVKVIFVVGNPLEAVLSLFRRGMQNQQAISLGNYFYWKREDLASYIKTGRDSLGLEKQLDRWLDPELRTYKVLIVRFERLWDNLDKVAEYLDLPCAVLSELPPQEKRNSQIESLPSCQRIGLQEIYKQYLEKLDWLGDCKIV